MPAIWQWGLAVIVTVQHWRSPPLDALMRAFTFLGDEPFYLLLLPLLLWSIDARFAARLGVVFLLSVVANGILKDWFMQPRPADLDPTVALIVETGYGLPSGHAQSAAVVWGSVAGWIRRGWLKATAIVVAAFVGISRVYLGVHFPTDVAAGWGIGAALLVPYLLVLPHAIRAGARLPAVAQLLVIAVVPALIAAAYPQNVAVGAMGALSGIGIGLLAFSRRFHLDTEGSALQRGLRFALGAPLTLAIYFGLRAVLSNEASTWYLTFRFVRYGIVGLWIGFGALWLFRRLRL